MKVIVIFEGPENSGKRSLADALCAVLDANAVPYKRDKVPAGQRSEPQEILAVDTSAGLQHLPTFTQRN